jgi:catechol 2,3-dioxygenase
MGFHTKPNLYIRNITLNVSNLEQSLVFYTNFLGFKVLEKNNFAAVLTADGKTPIIYLNQPEGVLPKQPRTTGLFHFAILLPSREELGKFLSHIVKTQFRIQGASDHLVSEALYLADPDGNGIEIYWDRTPDTWTWKNNMVEMSTLAMDIEGVLAAGRGQDWEGMPKETVMGHIHLHVADLKQARQFYTQGLGYELVCDYGGQADFISTGRYHHHIGMNIWNGIGAKAPSENSVGLKEYTISIPNEEYKQKVIHSLQELNFSFHESDGKLYTKDPSNNRIVLQLEK